MDNYLRKYNIEIAISYCVVASLSAVIFSYFEGTLVKDHEIVINGVKVIQHAYIKNISTILDFGIFNPIAIYFLIKAKTGFHKSYSRFGIAYDISQFNRIGIAIVSLVVGISTMWFYFNGFVGEVFFTAVFEPNNVGVARISMTGWAIFVSTSIALSIFVYSIIELGNYILFVRALSIKDVAFQLPPEISDDIKTIITPCLNVLYALSTLFFVLCVFIYRDYYQYDIQNSTRIWLFLPYLIACLFIFLPFFHLRKIMLQHKSFLVEKNKASVAKDNIFDSSISGKTETKFDSDNLLSSIDLIQKLHTFHNSIPTWPAKKSELFLPNVSILISLITLTIKVSSLFKAAI